MAYQLILGKRAFPPVMCASGALGFFGEGYPFHKKLWFLGPNFTGAMLVAKTATLMPRLGPGRGGGNMPLGRDDLTPTEWKPACIQVTPGSWWRGAALNAVGLSNPGLQALVDLGRWQALTQPFMVSVMAMAESPELRLKEMDAIADILERLFAAVKTNVGIELNVSCPNTGHDVERMTDEAIALARRLKRLGVPLLVKVNLLATDDMAMKIMHEPAVSGLTFGNTLPWGKLPERVDWKRLSPTGTSPLAHLGGGGLSGAPLLELVLERVVTLKKKGLGKPIVFCGGVLGPRDAKRVIQLGHVDGIQLGSIAFLRPWRVQSTIRVAQTAFNDRMCKGA